MADSENNLIRIDIPKIRHEAKLISKQVEKGNISGLEDKYSCFYLAYPILFKNLIEKKMSFEEVDVLLDAFDRAQNHFIDNFRN
jgi:hypothetical protein